MTGRRGRGVLRVGCTTRAPPRLAQRSSTSREAGRASACRIDLSRNSASLLLNPTHVLPPSPDRAARAISEALLALARGVATLPSARLAHFQPTPRRPAPSVTAGFPCQRSTTHCLFYRLARRSWRLRPELPPWVGALWLAGRHRLAAATAVAGSRSEAAATLALRPHTTILLFLHLSNYTVR